MFRNRNSSIPWHHSPLRLHRLHPFLEAGNPVCPGIDVDAVPAVPQDMRSTQRGSGLVETNRRGSRPATPALSRIPAVESETGETLTGPGDQVRDGTLRPLRADPVDPCQVPPVHWDPQGATPRDDQGSQPGAGLGPAPRRDRRTGLSCRRQGRRSNGCSRQEVSALEDH